MLFLWFQPILPSLHHHQIITAVAWPSSCSIYELADRCKRVIFKLIKNSINALQQHFYLSNGIFCLDPLMVAGNRIDLYTNYITSIVTTYLLTHPKMVNFHFSREERRKLLVVFYLSVTIKSPKCLPWDVSCSCICIVYVATATASCRWWRWTMGNRLNRF